MTASSQFHHGIRGFVLFFRPPSCLGLIEDSPWVCFRMTALAGAAAVLRDGLCTVENVVPLGTIDEVTAHTSSIITEV